MARATWNSMTADWNDSCISWDGVECTPLQSGQATAAHHKGSVRPAPTPVVMPNALTRAAQGEWE